MSIPPATEQKADAGTILIVDDARLNRELLRMSLLKHGYRFRTANNGREAIEQLQLHPEIDLIILDLMMPVMNGYEFLEWRKDHPEFQVIPVIVNSSLDDFESLIRALNMDAYDYFTKPLSNHDLELVLPIKIRNAVNSRRLYQETRRQNEIMRRELEMAARYQQFLLPQAVTLRGVKVSHLFQPCSGVGGDYFDFFQLPEGEVGVVVADVAGHGVASAMTASIVKALLPGYLERKGSPAAAFAALNDDLVRLTQEDVFVTAFAGIFQADRAALVWSMAGHPPPLLLSGDRPPLRLSASSLFLGALESSDPMVEFSDQTLALKPGDRLALYTDGLTEAPDTERNLYGIERLEALLDEHRKLEISKLRDLVLLDLQKYTGGEFPDDVAFILMEFQA